MWLRTICEAAVVVMLIAGMFFADRLIDFEKSLPDRLFSALEVSCAAVVACRYRRHEAVEKLRRHKREAVATFRTYVREMRATFRAYKRDVKAIYRACKRQGITFCRFVAMLWEERKGSEPLCK